MFAGLDPATGQMFYRFRDHKRWPQVLDFCKRLRRRFPVGKLYLVCDNYGHHAKAEVTSWCTDHAIDLVYTPTNASLAQLDRVRVHRDPSLHPRRQRLPHSHTARETAIASDLRWHNKRAHPKRRFAIDSKIRRPDYLPNIA
jgi:hypothetical protein